MTDPARHAAQVSPQLQEALGRRLRRIEGQIRGLQRMVEEERYCPEVLTQISSAQQALAGVARELLRNHLEHCVYQAMRADDTTEQKRVIQELIALWGKG